MNFSQKDIKNLKRISKETRIFCEDYARKHSLPEDLRGLCMLASELLCQKIVQETTLTPFFVTGLSELDPITNSGHGHCWVEIMDTRIIIDLTFSQYNPKSRIYFSKKYQNPHLRSYWHSIKSYNYRKDQKYLKKEFSSWHIKCRPLHLQSYPHKKLDQLSQKIRLSFPKMFR